MPSPNQQIGQASKLKLWRAYAGITQAQLGAMLDKPVSKQMVHKWERGMLEISKERLAEIRKKLYIPAYLCKNTTPLK